MSNQLTSMEVFVKAAESGSFAAAASQLAMSAQAVGKHVATLEKRLGARLLNRSTHTQSLTEAGIVYLAGCRRALAEAQAADASVSALTNTATGTLRVTAPLGFGGGGFLRSIVRFLNQQPTLGIELMLSDQTVDLIAEGYDAAIRIGNLPDSSLIARTLAPYRLVACASPSYLKDRGVPTKPADLIKHECLDYIFPKHPSPHLWSFIKDDRTVEVIPHARLVINDGRALVEAAVGGFGVVLVGEMKVREHLADGRLIRVLADYDNPCRPLQVVYASQRTQTLKVRVFVDWLIEEFARS
jgi:DNA-binding transcriptional LysR family regulator